MTASASDRRKGTLIATIGVLLVTPDAVLIRWATHLGASMIMVLFWKLLFNFAIGTGIVVALEHAKGHSLRQTAQNAYKGGRWMIIATSLQALIGVSFPTSFLLTYAANALLCVSLNPIWSAIFGWCLLKDSLPPRTIGALVAAVVAIAIMFVPRMVSGGPASPGDARRHAGNAVALLTGFLLSFFLIVARMAGKRDQNVPIQAASIMGAGIAGVIMGCASVVSGQPVYDPTISPFFYVAMAFDGLGLASVFIAFSIAPKYVGSAQVGLIWLLVSAFLLFLAGPVLARKRCSAPFGALSSTANDRQIPRWPEVPCSLLLSSATNSFL